MSNILQENSAYLKNKGIRGTVSKIFSWTDKRRNKSEK